MQIVLNSDETTEVLACGLRVLHGFDSKITDLDILKQRTGETITTITLASMDGRKVVDEGADRAEAPVEATIAEAVEDLKAETSTLIPTEAKPESESEPSGSVFD